MIRGYRVWYATHEGWLQSVASPIPQSPIWLRGKNKAICPCGIFSHACGFYAMKQLVDVEVVPCRVVGSVVLYGKIVEAEKGYRAEYAEIDAIFRSSTVSNELLELVAQRYGVEIVDAEMPQANDGCISDLPLLKSIPQSSLSIACGGWCNHVVEGKRMRLYIDKCEDMYARLCNTCRRRAFLELAKRLGYLG